MRKLLLNLAVAISAVAVLGATSARDGEQAPPFSATDLHGNQVSLSSLKGNVVVIHFAASW
ncbi:MAG TPA: redoxin domain-containing protein [Thermoanaerobaculia bacterium]|nr:redoxin domain-containing protein [Thermoanaerobaculia bacterium]